MSAPLHSFAALGPGDPAPMFHQRCTSNPRFAFDTVGGHYEAAKVREANNAKLGEGVGAYRA